MLQSCIFSKPSVTFAVEPSQFLQSFWPFFTVDLGHYSNSNFIGILALSWPIRTQSRCSVSSVCSETAEHLPLHCHCPLGWGFPGLSLASLLPRSLSSPWRTGTMSFILYKTLHLIKTKEKCFLLVPDLPSSKDVLFIPCHKPLSQSLCTCKKENNLISF